MVVRRGGALQLPSSTVVQFHPVVLAVFNFDHVSSSLGKKSSEIFVIGSFFKSEIANVAQINVEFFYEYISISRSVTGISHRTNQESRHIDL